MKAACIPLEDGAFMVHEASGNFLATYWQPGRLAVTYAAAASGTPLTIRRYK